MFACVENTMVRPPNHFPLQARERYCHYHISLNPIAQLSSPSHNHGKKGVAYFWLITIRVLNEGHLLSGKLSQSLSLLLKLFHFL